MAETPDKVAELATTENSLTLDALALLGTTMAPDGPRALIRTATGQIKTVAPGDRIGTAEVQAIGTGTVQISSLGGVKTLTMPEG